MKLRSGQDVKQTSHLPPPSPEVKNNGTTNVRMKVTHPIFFQQL